MLSFQRLEVSQRSIEFLALALEVIAELPTKGHADIADRLRRAAQSQPLNIAEGAGRTSRPDIAKHYTIARGSAMECAAILDVMRLQQTIKPRRYVRGVAPPDQRRRHADEDDLTPRAIVEVDDGLHVYDHVNLNDCRQGQGPGRRQSGARTQCTEWPDTQCVHVSAC